ESPSFFLTADGQVVVRPYFPKIGITAEVAAAEVSRHPYWCGPRDDNDVSPYSTLVANPDVPGSWIGIQLDGRLFKIAPNGNVQTLAGEVILPDSDVVPYQFSDSSISTDQLIAHQKTRKGIFADGLYFNMPDDLAFDPRDSKILYVADTGNHRIAKVDFH